MNILIAWAVSWVALAVAMQAWSSVQTRSAGNFLEGVLAGLVGLGVLLAIPTVLFAVLIGWPMTYLLSGLRPEWLIILLAGPLLASVMKVLMKVLLPNGWQGVEQGLIIYAGILGFVWGMLSILSPI